MVNCLGPCIGLKPFMSTAIFYLSNNSVGQLLLSFLTAGNQCTETLTGVTRPHR